MLRKIFALVIIISMIIFISGCTQQQVSTQEEKVSMEDIENQAIQEIEKEMNEALENITIEDIEKALTE